MQVNDQWICDKGRFAYAWVNNTQRLTMPLVRKNGQLAPVSWTEALKYVADRLQEIKQTHGADAIGGIGSAKLSNESNYLLQRFMRQMIGTNNIDHRDGGAVAALPTGLPALADVMKPQHGPKPNVDTIFLFGVDPSEELPILDLHLKRAVRKGGAKLIIAHPRKIELSRYQGPYLGYRPGTEATLLNALTKVALAAGSDEKPRVEQMVSDVTNQQLQDLCGVDPAEVKRAGELLAQSKQALIIYGPLAARGADGQNVVNGLTNLAMVSGHYERLAYVGLEANSQGCRDMGVLPNLLPGYANVDDADAHRRLENRWGGSLPTQAGKTYKEMLDGAGSSMKALYVMGANPASESAEWVENLGKLDLLVVQELFLTETAQKAHVVLPAVSWVESSGTFTNLERRVQRAPKAIGNPESKAAPDWMILDHLVTHLGKNWAYVDTEGILEEITEVVPIYKGLTWEALGDQGLQWDASAVRPRPVYRKVQQPSLDQEEQQPLIVVRGTVLYDGGTMFRLTEKMQAMAFGARAGLNPADAERLGIADGTDMVVSNRHGSLALTAKVDDQVQPGTIWIPDSLSGAPVGVLLNGSTAETVAIRAKQ